MIAGAATVVIPFLRGGNRDWLQQALDSFPNELPKVVAENDGDLAGALNRALRDVKTPFAMLFAADDVALPGLVDRLLGPAWNADVVYPAMVVTDADLNPIGRHEAAPFCGQRLLDMNYISGSVLIRPEKALAIGGYRRLKALEDWDLWLRMHRAGARFKPCPDAEFLYRRHDGSRNDQVAGQAERLTAYRNKIVLGRRRWLRRPDPLERVQATFYNSATPATTYLRCQLPARYLPAIVRPDLLIAESETELLFPEQRGKTAVLQIAADASAAFGAIALKDRGVRVLVESDDNYLTSPGRQIRERQQWEKTIKTARARGRRHSTQGHRWIVAQADGVIVTTEFLARQYRKLNPNVYVCPNTVDPVDWPDPVKPDDGVLRIVWSASFSHADDIELVTRAFEWASRQPGVEVYAAGINPGWTFKHGRLPWFDDLDAYRESFRYFDIGVAPIKPTPFSLGRSDVKALEYAMGGCAPVLSDVAPYAPWTADENCLKARSAKGFLRALQQLVRNRDETKQLAAAARSHVLAERTTQAQLHHWQEAIDG